MFSSALAMAPHLHPLVPEGVWSQGAWVVLPPPGQEEVEAVLARVVKQVSRAFEAEDSCWPEDGFEKLQAEEHSYG